MERIEAQAGRKPKPKPAAVGLRRIVTWAEPPKAWSFIPIQRQASTDVRGSGSNQHARARARPPLETLRSLSPMASAAS